MVIFGPRPAQVEVTWATLRACGARMKSVGDMKRLLLLLLIVAVPFARADDSKLSPELRANHTNQQVQVIVQYAPGTQVNCSGLLGLVGCLVNDVLKLGGTILGDRKSVV